MQAKRASLRRSWFTLDHQTASTARSITSQASCSPRPCSILLPISRQRCATSFDANNRRKIEAELFGRTLKTSCRRESDFVAAPCQSQTQASKRMNIAPRYRRQQEWRASSMKERQSDVDIADYGSRFWCRTSAALSPGRATKRPRSFAEEVVDRADRCPRVRFSTGHAAREAARGKNRGRKYTRQSFIARICLTLLGRINSFGIAGNFPGGEIASEV